MSVLVSEVPALRDYFYPVAYGADLTVEPRRVELFGQGYAIWRPSPGWPAEAAADECPHRGARLSQGWLADGCVVCPYHGWRFEAGGACTLIPQNDPSLPIPPRARLLTAHCEERYGLVWLCIGTPRAGVPDFPHAGDADYVLRHEFLEEWAASAPRVVDNSLDISHVAWVHRGTVGDPEFPMLPPFEVERHRHGLRFHLTYVSKVSAAQKANLGMDVDYAERSTFVDLVQPLCFTAILRYANGVEHVLYKGASPIDDHRSLFWQLVARNDAPDEARWATIVGMDRAVTGEDRPILEGIPADFPLQTTTEVHTRSDRMTVEYRRLLGELASESGLPIRPDRLWSRTA